MNVGRPPQHPRCLRAALCSLLTASLLSCAQAPTTTPAPTVASGGAKPAPAAPAREQSASPGGLYSLFHRALATPEGTTAVLRLHGHGAQIFQCEPQGGSGRWKYRLPEAELLDDKGALVVRHGANLSFEHVDGSRLVSEIVDHVPAPSENSLPWLLLSTRSFGSGALAGITHVQRTQTTGGMPPASCGAAQFNQVLRVPFTAEFVFLR